MWRGRSAVAWLSATWTTTYQTPHARGHAGREVSDREQLGRSKTRWYATSIGRISTSTRSREQNWWRMHAFQSRNLLTGICIWTISRTWPLIARSCGTSWRYSWRMPQSTLGRTFGTFSAWLVPTWKTTEWSGQTPRVLPNYGKSTHRSTKGCRRRLQRHRPPTEKLRYCGQYQRGACHEKGDHGGLKHMCAYCYKVKATPYPHLEADCRRKSGEQPKTWGGGGIIAFPPRDIPQEVTESMETPVASTEGVSIHPGAAGDGVWVSCGVCARTGNRVGPRIDRPTLNKSGKQSGKPRGTNYTVFSSRQRLPIRPVPLLGAPLCTVRIMRPLSCNPRIIGLSSHHTRRYETGCGLGRINMQRWPTRRVSTFKLTISHVRLEGALTLVSSGQMQNFTDSS